MKKIWIEYLRVISVIAVIILHVTAADFINFEQSSLYNWWMSNILNSICSFSVPMFIMVSGCVLLGRNYDIKEFYLKRGIRLLPPFVFWSVFYAIIDNFHKKNAFFIIIKKLTIDLFIAGNTHGHLWYLTMFICLMLFAPFINKYVLGEKTEIKDFYYLLLLFSLLMALFQISLTLNKVFQIKMYWFWEFPWYVGYFIMGYFIDIYHEKINIRNSMNILLLLVVILTSCVLNFYFASKFGIAGQDFVLNFHGLATFITTTSLFYLFSKNRGKISEIKAISSVSTTSFGIYLIHPFFVPMIRDHITSNINDPIISVTLLIIITFIFSHTSIIILRKIKWFQTVC